MNVGKETAFGHLNLAGATRFFAYATNLMPLSATLRLPPDFGQVRRDAIFEAIKTQYESYRVQKEEE